ncbi:carnitine O-palmitoyltransferase 2, mitochondrial [Bombyx mandarina]|uniref:Choline/carnitine acyltransferase domain-containing protein n=2 Tax=Bombyx TaxID=7090 RepID=A0A8R2C7Q4_BOMMO|nr:carnitine O-palmitoyltransferase 2, mitochondrial [Bombyx mori]XP_028034037.1 carnitine O-palmitoyltransferase 2, mitochondrial [Bombyx mandarina]XP_037870518.1 carnitine O-palmitoyltransferase 2, mitochondrial [Bombyx mori]
MISPFKIYFYNNLGTVKVLQRRNFTNKFKHIKDVDYQFLQKSKVPTMHFQKSLPRLPIPDLQKTGDRYLRALKPLLTNSLYDDAQQRTLKFVNGEGLEIQEKLISKDKMNKNTSYISDYWFDLYLRDRAALPINFNPYLVFQNDIKPEYNDQLIRATNLLISAVRFMLSLREHILEPEVYHLNAKKSDTPLFRTVTGLLPEAISWYGAYLFKAFPLDMSQFVGLFGATRLPQIGKDKLFRDPKSKHVLVQRRGRFYAFDVLDKDGNLLSPAELLGNLSKIIRDDTGSAEHPLGYLTCQTRDLWAKQRAHLEENGNKQALHVLDTAIFNLIFDDDVIEDDKNKLLKHYLCGNGNNRWFDKSFSLIVTKDGVSGINFEHSWGDGVAVLRFFQDIYNETTTKPFVHPDSQPSTSNITVQELQFNLDEKSKKFIQDAKQEYDNWCDSLSIDYILYEGLTKGACKKFKVSPDCIMQLAFQAAYHLIKGKFVGTYESCSTSAFKHGRTETMRPCTEKTKAFCEALNVHKKSKDELRVAMGECSAYHSELVKQAAMGQGFDRHLFALMKIAEENDIPRPELFDSYEYKFLNKSILSTSTLSAPSVMAGGFGPVAQEGFGIGYSAFPDKLGAAVSSYKTHNSSTEFVQALHTSFLEITRILSG